MALAEAANPTIQTEGGGEHKEKEECEISCTECEKIDKLVRKYGKKTFEYEKDFFSFTCFLYLRENDDNFALNANKRSQALYSTIIVAITILSMLICMFLEVLER